MKDRLIIVFFLIVLGGCSQSQVPTLVKPSETAIQIPTETPIPIPSETLEPTTIPLIDKEVDFEVRFTGDSCLVSGVSEVSAGEYTFKFIQSNDLKGELWLLNLEEGKTIQDIHDGQSEPSEWYPKPNWIDYDKRISFEYETVNNIRVIISRWSLDKVGEHIISCYVGTPEKKMWFTWSINVANGGSE